jgi:hypothetical protein
MGLDIETIRILGRWENLEMVQRYTRAYTFDDANKLLKLKIRNVPDLLSI